MDTSSLKNIVVLKDLPSNLVEEAIVVLKENQKIEKLEPVDKSQNKKQSLEKSITGEVQNKKDYIVKEAQLLIAEYISRIENKNKKESQSFQTLKQKYKKLKTVNHLLIGALILSAFVQFII